MAVIRSAGIVDHEVARQGRIGIVVIGARHRLPQMSREIRFEVLFGEIARQRLARRQAGDFADPPCQSRRQAIERRSEIPACIHAAHQTHGLLRRRAGIAQRLRVEGASAHALDKVWRAKMVRLAFRAKHRVDRTKQHGGRKSRRAQAESRFDERAHAPNPELKILQYRQRRTCCQAAPRTVTGRFIRNNEQTFRNDTGDDRGLSRRAIGFVGEVLLFFRPLDVAAVDGHHHDFGAGGDERRHHGAHAVGEPCGLVR